MPSIRKVEQQARKSSEPVEVLLSGEVDSDM